MSHLKLVGATYCLLAGPVVEGTFMLIINGVYPVEGVSGGCIDCGCSMPIGVELDHKTGYQL